MRKKFVEVELRGGLGNQLFIFAAGFALAKRLGAQIRLNSWRFTHDEKRDNQVQSLLNRVRVKSHRPGKFGFSLVSKFVEPHFDYCAQINELSAPIYLEGYFQSELYFADCTKELVKLFDGVSANFSQRALTGLGEDAVVLHIRRGDYLDPKTEAFHGLTPVRFFQRASSHLYELGFTGPRYVFTDSPDVLALEIKEEDWLLVDDTSLSDFEVMHLMGSGAALVTSNSSFSWWAAWWGEQRGLSKVVVPSPWFKGNLHTPTLIPSRWEILPA